MARPASPVVERSARLRPQAEIVDAYVRPPTPPRSPLHDLASALKSVSSDLSGFLKEREEKAANDAMLRGAAAAHKANPQGQAAGVAQGLIPAHESPHFVKGYKKAQGEIAGIKLKQMFDAEYDAWDGKDSEEEGAFDRFYHDFVKRHVTSDDPGVLEGLVPHLDDLATHGYRRYTEDRAKGTYNKSLVTHGARFGQSIDLHSQQGLESPTGTDYDQLHRDLMRQRDEATTTGIRGADIDKQYVDAIVAKALEHKDPQLLSLLDKPVPDEDYNFSDTPYGREQKQQAINKLEEIARSQQAAMDREGARQEKLNKDRTTRAAIDALVQNPGQPLDEKLLAEGSKYDPEFRVKVLRWQDALLKEGREEDPAALLQIDRDILNGAGMAAIQRGLESGAIRSSATLQNKVRFLETVQKEGSGEGTVLQGPIVSSVMGAIKERTAEDRLNLNPWGITDAGIAAQTDYQRLLIQWRQANPNATLGEIRKAQQDIGKMVLDGIAKPEGFGETPQYTRPTTANQILDGQRPNPEPRPEQPRPAPNGRPDATPQRQGAAPSQPTQQQQPAQRPAAPAATPAQRFDPEGDGYDDATAQQHGLKRDDTGHMQSRVEFTPEQAKALGVPEGSGLILKGRNHPTWDKTVKGEQDAGFKIIKHRGRYISVPADTPDAKPDEAPGKQGNKESGMVTGNLSAKYESGGRGVHTISTGKGDPGGVSYGTHQLASKTGTMAAFLRSPEAKQFAARFAGHTPGSQSFNAVYKAVAQEAPESFAAAQKAYIVRTHYAPVEKHAAAKGFNTSDRAVAEVLYSISVQHAGAKQIVTAAAGAAKGSVQQQINALYDARIAYVRAIKKMPEDTRQSLLNRYASERRDAIKLASTGSGSKQA